MTGEVRPAAWRGVEHKGGHAIYGLWRCRIEQGRGGEEKEMQRDGILTDYKYLLAVIEGYLMEIASTLR